jgi:hypothetical protein
MGYPAVSARDAVAEISGFHLIIACYEIAKVFATIHKTKPFVEFFYSLCAQGKLVVH